MSKRKNIHFRYFNDFNTKKLSADSGNTTYTIGVSTEVKAGTPEIVYNAVVYVKDTKQFWTHGALYDFALKEATNTAISTLSSDTNTRINALSSSTDSKFATTNANVSANTTAIAERVTKADMYDVEEAVAAALDDLDARVRSNKAKFDSYTTVDDTKDDEEVTAAALNDINDRVGSFSVSEGMLCMTYIGI